MVMFTTFSFAIISCLWASTVRVFNIPDPTRNGITPSRNQRCDDSNRNNESIFVPKGVPQFILINGVIFKLLRIRSTILNILRSLSLWVIKSGFRVSYWDSSIYGFSNLDSINILVIAESCKYK